jgi:hypothetical protein
LPEFQLSQIFPTARFLTALHSRLFNVRTIVTILRHGITRSFVYWAKTASNAWRTGETLAGRGAHRSPRCQGCSEADFPGTCQSLGQRASLSGLSAFLADGAGMSFYASDWMSSSFPSQHQPATAGTGTSATEIQYQFQEALRIAQIELQELSLVSSSGSP